MSLFIKVFSKLTTRPVWLYERNRPYFLQHKLNRLSPLKCQTSHSSIKINILSTPSTITEAAFSAYSWCKYLGHLFSIRIIVDGDYDNNLKLRLGRIIDGINIVSASELIKPHLITYPGLLKFGEQHPLGRKLLLALCLQETEDFIYSDNDVLLFRYPRELIRAINSRMPVYNQEFGNSCYDLEIAAKADEIGLSSCERFNSGFFFCPSGSFNLASANELASVKAISRYSWFDEQTILAFLMGEANAKPLSRDHYVVNTKRQFWWDPDVDYSKIASRHFTGPVRHLMYSKGYARL